MNIVSKVVAALVLLVVAAFGQTTMTSTTLASAVGAGDSIIYVTSASGFSGVTTQTNTQLYVDREAMKVVSVSGTAVTVIRGDQGTTQSAHKSGAVLWYGPPSAYGSLDPVGACTSTAVGYLPRVAILTGSIWTCPSAGANSGQWIRSNQAASVQAADASFFVPAAACVSTVSGNGTGTNGLTVVGASSTPVIQASTSATGTNTHSYLCAIDVPSRLTSGKGAEITAVTFLYGVQSSALGTQAATLASGTLNSATVFSYIHFPTPAASETASTVTPVRLDSGSLTITPVVASANTATTTAGAFYSMKFTPSAPLAVNTDLRRVLLNVTLQCAATSATVTNSPGLIVYYNNVAD